MATDLSDGAVHETNWIYTCYDYNNGDTQLTNNTASVWSNSSTSNYGWRLKSSGGSWITSYCGRCWIGASYNAATNTITFNSYVTVKSPGADNTTWHSQVNYGCYTADGTRLLGDWGSEATAAPSHSQNTSYLLQTYGTITIPDGTAYVKCWPYWWCGSWGGDYGANIGGRVYWSSSEFQFIFNSYVWISDGTNWKRAIPYISDGTNWKKGASS